MSSNREEDFGRITGTSSLCFIRDARGRIYQSSDRGKSWVLNSDTGSSFNNLQNADHFNDALVVFTTRNDDVYYSTDQGTSWSNSVAPTSFIHDVAVLDENTIVVGGSSSEIARSVDGGANWITVVTRDR